MVLCSINNCHQDLKMSNCQLLLSSRPKNVKMTIFAVVCQLPRADFSSDQDLKMPVATWHLTISLGQICWKVSLGEGYNVCLHNECLYNERLYNAFKMNAFTMNAFIMNASIKNML